MTTPQVRNPRLLNECQNLRGQQCLCVCTARQSLGNSVHRI
uniref:Uncharacterized protein n=1 Tax=Anguilla anguilla TaxID=7936 RepID=A0A0E9PJL0_ANGAN